VKLILFLALLAGLAVFVLWKARAHEGRAEAAFPPEGRIIEVNGHRVHAVIMGDGPDIVLIHGASGNTRDLTFDLAPRLAARYRVIVLDRPGLGHTDRIDGDGASITEQAALLQAAAAALGAERPIVLGHSYGGAVALAWAVTRPEHVAALVILAGASHPWQSALPLEYRLLSHPLVGPLLAPVLTAVVPDTYVERAVAGIFAPQVVPEGYIAHVGAALTLRRDTLRENALQRANLLSEIEALHPLYAKITAPTEIVHGDRDTTVGLAIHAERLAEDIPEARLTVLPGVGHMPHHAAPDQVTAAIDRAAAHAGLRPAP
jgi:pimeloyl-ACP methyl ester carboxylesterase